MKKESTFLALFVFLLVLIPFTHGIDAKEYLKEFNVGDEVCEVIDIFHYQIHKSLFLNKNHHESTVPVFYNCKPQDSDGTIVIFDIFNKQFMENNYVSELIDLSYIKYQLNEGSISESNYINEGVDVCEFFGTSKLNKESLNLAAKTIEATKPLMSIKSAKTTTDVLKIGRGLNAINTFNPTNFIASVSCYYDNNLLNDAMESLVTCNSYLSNIKQDFAVEGYVSELNYCIIDSKAKLNKYIDSLSAKARHVVNKVGNMLSPVTSLFKSLFSGISTGDYELKIEDNSDAETEMERVRRLFNEISNNALYLKHPENNLIIDKYAERINFKNNQVNEKYTLVNSKHSEVLSKKPHPINVFLVDVFNEPNYNLSLAKDYIKNSSNYIDYTRILWNDYKFNSVLSFLQVADSSLNFADKIILREQAIERKFDHRWTIALITLAVMILVFLIAAFFIVRRNS